MAVHVVIRPAKRGELERVTQIERAADQSFIDVGLSGILDGPGPDSADYAPAQVGGRLFVALDDAGAVVGFSRVEFVEGQPHLEQVSVDPRAAGHRIGAQLVQAAEQWAASRGFHRMTLSTYRDVVWNGPYYERLGWVAVPSDELNRGLRELREHERRLGLDVQPRQVMAKELAVSG